MISVLLTILKILGIVLLVLLGIVLLLLILVLFVPVRYRLDAHRDLKEAEEKPVVALIRATWLWRLLQVSFNYPEETFVRVKVFGITVYRSDREKEKKPSKSPEDAAEDTTEDAAEDTTEDTTEDVAEEKQENEQITEKSQENEWDEIETREQETEPEPKLVDFFKKLWEKIKNIKYTIRQICDKINHIVKNIKYYVRVIQSDIFINAYSLCSAQIFILLKSIRPRKVKGKLLIGTGDPAGTGQVLAVYGMLYPFLGNHIEVTPDFEQQVIEGELLVKGKITVCKALKVALTLFFNRDIRRLIKLLKREAK